MARSMNIAGVIAELERNPRLSGKRVGDIPELAGFRRKFRFGFYRVADVNFAALICNTLAALAPANSLWPVALALAGLNSWLILCTERRARMISRQLNRPASEQVARDLLGLSDD